MTSLTAKVLVKVVPGMKNIGGHESTICAGAANVYEYLWKSAFSSQFSWKSYAITCRIDCAPMIERIAYWNDVERGLKSSTPEAVNWFDPDNNEVSLDVELTIRCENDEELDSRGFLAFVELSLHELFLCANLSSPGALGFSIRSIDSDTFFQVPLDTYLFEDAWAVSVQRKDDLIGYIPFEKTLNWYAALSIGVGQVAKTRTQKALFALLHLCGGRLEGISAVPWLSYCIEALYDAPFAGIKKVVQDRMLSLLGVASQARKGFTKEFTEFYELRSKFMHGGLHVMHPMGNERLDQKVDDYWESLMAPMSFANLVIVATLQRMIKENWGRVDFRETYEGRNHDSEP